MIVDWQHEPMKAVFCTSTCSGSIFPREVVVKVPVHTHGDPVGVKVQGGHTKSSLARSKSSACRTIFRKRSTWTFRLVDRPERPRFEIPLTGSMRLISPADAVILHVVGLKATKT